MLDNNETLLLIEKAQNGDKDAKEILVRENEPLIKSVIKRFYNRNIESEDLFQLGCMGFIKAIARFDKNYNVKFSTYAVPMIAGEVKRFLRDDGYVKISRAVKTLAIQINKYIQEEKAIKNVNPSIDEISKKFNIEEQEVIFIMESLSTPLSLSSPFEENNSRSQSLIDKIVVDDNLNEDLLNNMLLKETIKNLDERDKTVILLRYFQDKTQSEIAKELNVSQVQVSRIENKIIEKIRSKIL